MRKECNMGVDTLIRLPEDARLRDVGDVLGALAGLPVSKMELTGDAWYVRVKGVSIRGYDTIPELAAISLHGAMVDGQEEHFVSWHWEPEEGGRLLMPRATAFWIAIGRGLVRFFGGEIVYNDCTGNEADFKCKKPRKRNNPQDGDEWQGFQEEKFEVKPITKKKLDQAEELAAYKTEKK
jgi:hypothetical protein